jgi:DNA-binding PadR family transcriptional regulator
VAGLFGLAQAEPGRGPRVRRGDVRSAILDVVHTAQHHGEEINGYQVIQQIGERYPTIQQLEDEGLLRTVELNSRRSLELTDAGQQYVADHADQLTAVWAPFAGPDAEEPSGVGDLRPEIGQLMGAVWQIVSTGSDAQRRAAVEILVETRRKLYGVLADGDPDQDTDQETGEDT